MTYLHDEVDGRPPASTTTFRSARAVGRASWLAALAASLALAACSTSPGSLGESNDELRSRRWVMPDEVAQIGLRARVAYNGAPNWNRNHCGDGLLEGTQKLGEYLESQFAQVSEIGGFSCRQNTANTSKMSVHGTGRALDVFVPVDSEQGDQIANWLVINADAIGVQMIIWSRMVWRANGKPARKYGGPHPHNDHLHVELNKAAANLETAFFGADGGLSRSLDGGRGDEGATDGGLVIEEPEEEEDENDAEG